MYEFLAPSYTNSGLHWTVQLYVFLKWKNIQFRSNIAACWKSSILIVCTPCHSRPNIVHIFRTIFPWHLFNYAFAIGGPFDCRSFRRWCFWWRWCGTVAPGHKMRNESHRGGHFEMKNILIWIHLYFSVQFQWAKYSHGDQKECLLCL